MGAHNVVLAIGVADDKISLRARMTLVVMSLVALDRDYGHNRARYYYGGHDRILEMQHVVAGPAAMRRVRRDVAELVAAGLVERVGWANRHRVYLLHLGPPVVDNSRSAAHDIGPPGDRST